MKLAHVRILYSIALVLLGFAVEPAHAVVLAKFDASLGGLPQQQGFVLEEDVNSHPAPLVEGSALHQYSQNSASAYQRQFWFTQGTAFDFTTNTYSIEADLQVISSNYIQDSGFGDGPRVGYYVGVASQDGRGYLLGIASEGITLQNNVQALAPVVAFSSTDAFHIYRLDISSNSASVFIDNIFIASIGAGSTSIFSSQFGGAQFGDFSGLGVSETLTRSFTVSSAVPETRSIAMFLAGLVFLGLYRRRL